VRTIALLVGGTLLFAGFQTGIDPGVRTAFLHGGVRFFTFAALGAVFLTFTLVLTARLAHSRSMALWIAVGGIVLQLTAIVVGDVGFALLKPEPAVAEAIADTTSPIGVAHEIARRNGTTPGRAVTVRLFPVLPALAVLLVDPRRRPVAAGLAFGLALYVVNGVMFLRSPALSHARPDGMEALVALVITAFAALAATAVALAFERRTTSDVTPARVAAGAVPVTRGV